MEAPSVTCSAVSEFADRYVRPCAGRTLIVGSRVYPGRDDRRERYQHAEGWDALAGPGVDRVVDLEADLPPDAGLFQHIDCISVLEHSRRPWRLARNIEHLLAVGGTLFIEVPFVWRIHGYPSDYWRFTIDGVRALFSEIDWRALRYANGTLREQGEKVPGVVVHDHPYLARTEVCAFGVRQ